MIMCSKFVFIFNLSKEHSLDCSKRSQNQLLCLCVCVMYFITSIESNLQCRVFDKYLHICLRRLCSTTNSTPNTATKQEHCALLVRAWCLFLPLLLDHANMYVNRMYFRVVVHFTRSIVTRSRAI